MIIKQIHILPKRKSHSVTAIIMVVLASMFFSCANIRGEVKKYKAVQNELEALLNPATYSGKTIDKKYLPVEVIGATDPVYVTLKNKGILTNNSYILYSSPDCISLVTRVKGNAQEFTDHVVMTNRNEGQFACNINSIYTLNQDDNVNRLHIGAYRITSLTNLFIVDNK